MEDSHDFSDDYPRMPSKKVRRRVSFVEESMLNFISRLNEDSRRKNPCSTYVFDLNALGLIVIPAKVVYTYLGYRKLIGLMVAHGSNNPFIDRHKIIAGKQAAVMLTAPLRVRQYAGLTDAALNAWRCKVNDKPYLNLENIDSKDRPFIETMLLNAGFAFSLGVDILCRWNGLQQNASEFIMQNANLYSNYTRLLLNTFISQSTRPTYNCCFFWCSHLWFMLEEKLLASAGRR